MRVHDITNADSNTNLLQIATTFLVLGLHATAMANEPVGQAAYEQRVVGLLSEFCADCHGRETSEGRWAFDGYADYAALVADQDSWSKVLKLVTHHIMPPTGQAVPTLAQRKTIQRWIDDSVFYVDPNDRDPGRATLRRLNRTEYNNTVRDVLGISFRPADQFPADDSGYGFDNIADVLSVSPLHYEKYRTAARDIAEYLTEIGAPPRVGIELAAEKISLFAGAPELREKRFWLHSTDDEVGTTVQVPVNSTYRILARGATARDEEGNLQRIEILCDQVSIGELQPQSEFKGKPGPQASAFALVELPIGEHRIALRLKSSATSPRSAANLATIGFMSVSGPFTPVGGTTSSFLRPALGGRPADTPILRLSGEDLDHGSGRNSLDTGRAWFSTNGHRHAPVLLKEPGEYRIRFKVGAQQVGSDPVGFECRVGDISLGTFSVTAESQTEQWVEARRMLPAGQHDWQVWFVNEFKDPDSGAERWFWLHEFTIEGPLGTDAGLSHDAALTLLKQTARRLFRRPLESDEAQKLTQLLETAMANQLPVRVALRVGLEALLISPHFLFHQPPKPLGKGNNGSALIDEFTLASRLSYFLWSSAPDDQLMTLAERGELRNQLLAQVRRMLADPRASSLTSNFAGQWLQLRNLDHVAPDKNAFREFDGRLARDMRRETELVFEHILRNNRSVLEFLNADYTFINGRLASHYGLPTPEGDDFQRTALAGSPRRGIVTHGSILTITSLPTRTSPVKRGKWVLEQLLGTEPPPPPADVPPLPATGEDVSLSLRERLEQHRADPSCAACHAVLDPIGFALEHYDATGRLRLIDSDHPIDASGRLISGETFTDWSDLRDLLATNHEAEFVTCFAKQLLTYALGREVTYRDKLVVAEILTRSRSSNYGFRDIIAAVCESVPFQRMRTP